MLDTFFIEWFRDNQWARYAGPFDTKERALNYLIELCGWDGYRIVRYSRTEIVQTEADSV